MSGKPSLPRLPPLSRQARDEVELIEQDAQDILEDCGDNFERARRTLRTGVMDSLTVQMDYYFSLANYQTAWIVELIPRTVDSLIERCPAFILGEQFRGELLLTAGYQSEQWLRAIKNEATTTAPPKPASSERIALRDSYLANFTGEKIKVIDICWAASQHRREWSRWLKQEVPDGSMPDLQFRRLLTSGKRPQEFKRQSRPPKWE